MREFVGGATRDTNEGKLAYTRFLSPVVLTEYCQYLERHRDTAKGRRDQDNWKQGIDTAVYMESLGRHFWEVWTEYESRGEVDREAVCGLLFNAMGMLYEDLKAEGQP